MGRDPGVENLSAHQTAVLQLPVNIQQHPHLTLGIALPLKIHAPFSPLLLLATARSQPILLFSFPY